MEIHLHPTSRRQLDIFLQDLPQSLLISGKIGTGLHTVAQWLGGPHYIGSIQPKNTKGELDPGGTISVEAIRALYDQTRTKHTTRRIIVIDDAERMSRGAQSAFLKLLEEPNASTHFILTSHAPSALLPTIRSRTQHVALQPLASTTELVEAMGVSDPTKKLQLQFIANGLPAEIIRLLGDESYFDKKAKMIADARIFLQGDTYQKLKIVHAYRSDREGALQLLESAIAIVRHTLNSKQQYMLISQLERLMAAQESILASQSISLQLTKIVL